MTSWELGQDLQAPLGLWHACLKGRHYLGPRSYSRETWNRWQCANKLTYRRYYFLEGRRSKARALASRKPWLSAIERGHLLDGSPFRARPYVPTVGEFPRSKHSVQTLYPTKMATDETGNRGSPVCIQTQGHTLKILQPKSKFGGLRKLEKKN